MSARAVQQAKQGVHLGRLSGRVSEWCPAVGSGAPIPTACRVWKGAGELYERALAIGEAALGPDHPTVATYRNNLGSVLQDLGDLEGARAQLERALTIGEAALGPDHPDVGIWRNNLGFVLQDLGDLAGARAQFERALTVGEATLGPDHPTVATMRANLDSLRRALHEMPS
ncbi:MAG: ATP/GTP-binding protein [Actinomycetia bacterium]|nr:ATP/GTP-binding protein [Actinomycetes bacterium]